MRKFCPTCGVTSKACPDCGAPISPNGTRCMSCAGKARKGHKKSPETRARMSDAKRRQVREKPPTS